MAALMVRRADLYAGVLGRPHKAVGQGSRLRVELAGSEMAAAPRRKKPPARAKRSLLASRPQLPALVFEAHHIDIVALALVAMGIFLAGVAYLHWAGGALGNGAVTGLRLILGDLGYAVPAVLVVARRAHPHPRATAPRPSAAHGRRVPDRGIDARPGGGDAGLGPGSTPAGQFWTAAAFERRGGIVGQAELWAASHLFSTIGADILAVFLFIAGALLVTGATVAGMVQAGRAHMTNTGRVLRRSTEDLTATMRRPATAAAKSSARRPAPALDDPIGVPSDEAEGFEPFDESQDTDEVVVRATHVEAPPAAELELLPELELEGAETTATNRRSGHPARHAARAMHHDHLRPGHPRAERQRAARDQRPLRRHVRAQRLGRRPWSNRRWRSRNTPRRVGAR